MIPYVKHFKILICVAKNIPSPAAVKPGVPPSWCWLLEAGWDMGHTESTLESELRE